MTKLFNPIKPGEILLEEFFKPLNISQNQFARDIDVPVSRVADIIKGIRSITPDTALRFAAAFGNSAEFWLNLQTGYDLRVLRRVRQAGAMPAITQYATK